MSEKESLLSMVNGIIAAHIAVNSLYAIAGWDAIHDFKLQAYKIARHELLKENADIEFVKKLLNKINNGEQTESR